MGKELNKPSDYEDCRARLLNHEIHIPRNEDYITNPNPSAYFQAREEFEELVHVYLNDDEFKAYIEEEEQMELERITNYSKEIMDSYDRQFSDSK